MRLSSQEIKAIQHCSAHFFPNSAIYLFGSRVDDNKKGGDIDLYIETKLEDTFNRKLNFLSRLKASIGEQKIDVLINDGSKNKHIFQTARKTGISIMNEYQENLEIILNECKQHTKRINYATQKMNDFMPLTPATFLNLSEDKMSYIDQFLFRFIKLQDTIGTKLFPNILLFLGEEIANKSFIDRLNRLEQLNLLDSKYAWNNLRKIRNDLSHQYEQVSNNSMGYLNNIYQKKEQLIGFYLHINQYYQVNYDH
ncbi:MAG: nucleotidyltransferase domain-containing protein [Methylococcales symbiont of Hymedesmia sp. n. MRB-2018]|nr:MAG: nucleotidyltransferase domain-containing protein [Methylococcales symbiont of Hymedesmia sp. n. MRB-2018]KAF3983338.1 MAG: nucleotidyltransferase domain-containing protein [Methylococcales symbiont of Hymedesmia sp. n. MRB-2018]